MMLTALVPVPPGSQLEQDQNQPLMGTASARDVPASQGQVSAPLCSPPYLCCQVVARGEVLEAVQAIPVPSSPSARVMVDNLGEAEESSAGKLVMPPLTQGKHSNDQSPVLLQRWQ